MPDPRPSSVTQVGLPDAREAPPVLAAITDPVSSWGPTQPDERISLIDVLRGLALFGIIAANMRGFAGPLTAYFQPDLLWKSRIDFWVQAFIDTFIQGKFITIFAFLFGVGFILQFERAEKKHSRFARVYVRRLSALILIGALHQLLFWWGDILISYALGGFLLIPFRKRQNKTILVWALSLMLLPIVGASGYMAYRHVRPESPQKIAEHKKKTEQEKQKKESDMWTTVRVYRTGNYPAIFKERLKELKRENMSQPFVVALTLPIFLLGFWVWRQGIIQNPAAHGNLLKKGLIIGALLGIPASIGFTWIAHLKDMQQQTGPPTPAMIFAFSLVIFGRPLMSMCYACAVALLFLNEAWRRRMMPFANIGRTALSNYLLQTVVGTTIFYGYGGRLFARVGLGWLFVLSIIIYALQVPLSRWWLAHHQFGTAEWIWRRMTYGKAQLEKRSAAAAA